MESFRDTVKMIDRMPPKLLDALFFRPWIKGFESLPKKNQKAYYKVPLLDEGGQKKLVMIYWAPTPNPAFVRNGTRPHSHGGSPVRVRILLGTLRQDVFSIDIDEAGRRRINSAEKYYVSQALRRQEREFIESPGSIHAISNHGLGHWSVSLHEFDAGFAMEVYDFGKNLKWLVRGDEDTLGDPPSCATQIWDEDGRVTIGP